MQKIGSLEKGFLNIDLQRIFKLKSQLLKFTYQHNDMSQLNLHKMYHAYKDLNLVPYIHLNLQNITKLLIM